MEFKDPTKEQLNKCLEYIFNKRYLVDDNNILYNYFKNTTFEVEKINKINYIEFECEYCLTNYKKLRLNYALCDVKITNSDTTQFKKILSKIETINSDLSVENRAEFFGFRHDGNNIIYGMKMVIPYFSYVISNWTTILCINDFNYFLNSDSESNKIVDKVFSDYDKKWYNNNYGSGFFYSFVKAYNEDSKEKTTFNHLLYGLILKTNMNITKDFNFILKFFRVSTTYRKITKIEWSNTIALYKQFSMYVTVYMITKLFNTTETKRLVSYLLLIANNHNFWYDNINETFLGYKINKKKYQHIEIKWNDYIIFSLLSNYKFFMVIDSWYIQYTFYILKRDFFENKYMNVLLFYFNLSLHNEVKYNFLRKNYDFIHLKAIIKTSILKYSGDEMRNKEVQIGTLTQQKTKLTNDLNRARNDIENVSSQLDTKKEELRTKTNQLTTSNERIRTLTKDNQDLRQKNKICVTESKEQEFKELKKQFEDDKKQHQKDKEDLNNLKKQFDKDIKEINSLNDEVFNLELTIKDLNKQVKANEEVKKILQSKIKKLEKSTKIEFKKIEVDDKLKIYIDMLKNDDLKWVLNKLLLEIPEYILSNKEWESYIYNLSIIKPHSTVNEFITLIKWYFNKIIVYLLQNYFDFDLVYSKQKTFNKIMFFMVSNVELLINSVMSYVKMIKQKFISLSTNQMVYNSNSQNNSKNYNINATPRNEGNIEDKTRASSLNINESPSIRHGINLNELTNFEINKYWSSFKSSTFTNDLFFNMFKKFVYRLFKVKGE